MTFPVMFYQIGPSGLGEEVPFQSCSYYVLGSNWPGMTFGCPSSKIVTIPLLNVTSVVNTKLKYVACFLCCMP